MMDADVNSRNKQYHNILQYIRSTQLCLSVYNSVVISNTQRGDVTVILHLFGTNILDCDSLLGASNYAVVRNTVRQENHKSSVINVYWTVHHCNS